ncbi:MAG: hypothetical protein D6722_12660 [Bacteroidetes bacterium]|nr:MAG: hypothetical protein D6722_12660 [Bacteroidota bacterium]
MKRLSLTGMNPTTRLALLDQATVSGSNFLLGVILLRALGSEGFGQYALLWMGAMLAAALHQALITTPMLTLGAKESGEAARRYDQAVTRLSLAGVLLLMLLAGLILGLGPRLGLPALPGDLQLSFVLGMGAWLLQDRYRRGLLLRQRGQAAWLRDLLAYGGLLAGTVALWALDALTLSRFFGLMAISFGLAALHRPGWPGRASLAAVWRRHLAFGRWLAANALLQFFSGNFFTLALAATAGAAAVGIVRMVQQPMGLLHVLFLVLEQVVPPQAARALHADGPAGLQQYLLRVSLRAGLGLALVLAVMAGGSSLWLRLLYGAEYGQYGLFLAAYAAAYLFIFPGYPLRFALRSLERTQPLFWAYVLSAGVSVLIAPPLVAAWGMFAVVAGVILTQVLMQAVYVAGLLRPQARFLPQ